MSSSHLEVQAFGARRLVLLRHAKAVTGEWGLDSERSLAPRGQRQAAAVGRDLAATGFEPDLALVSSAKRTEQTYQLVAVNAGWKLAPQLSGELYRAYVDELLELLRQVDPAWHRVLVVGHEPTMSATAKALAGPASNGQALACLQRGMPTAARAVLDFACTWAELSAGAGALAELVASGH
ncbi:MAG: histidine phosphatase family protein [Micrococcales bacterium]|nr:histidine phosphatase family protein [Micrococcales bacterium]